MTLLVHVAFFLVLAAAIVLLSAFYAHPDDHEALRTLPRRYLVFVASCAGVALAMLVLEHLFASV